MKGSYQSYSKVVERLGQYREQLGLSQTEMGRHLGVTQSHYQKLEKGMKVISRRSLEAFQNAGLDVFWLLTGTKKGSGILDDYLNGLESTIQMRKMLEVIIWVAEEGARVHRMEYDVSLGKAHDLLKICELNEPFIWKKIREVENLTQNQMAGLLEINIKRYRKMEKGEVPEDAAILASLYENLHYSPMLILNRKKYCLDELNNIWDKFSEPWMKRFSKYLEASSDILTYKEEE